MFKLSIEDKSYLCQSGETVLDTLLRENVSIPHQCRKGNCLSCKIQSLDVVPPRSAQAGLKETVKELNYFLACQHQPRCDMKLKIPGQSETYSTGTVVAHQFLNRKTVLLAVKIGNAHDYKAGQFVNVRRGDGLTRSYSIANRPHLDGTLELHIRRHADGHFSAWVHNHLKVGDTISISEPHGHCYYLPEKPEQALLLIGTGTGLAPLVGILSDALTQGHTGPVCLFHGAREIEDLYKINELRKLAEQHRNFRYTPCVSGSGSPEGFSKGRADEIAFSTFPKLHGWRVFLCGHPEMVTQSQKLAFLMGASLNDIYTDAFWHSKSETSVQP